MISVLLAAVVRHVSHMFPCLFCFELDVNRHMRTICELLEEGRRSSLTQGHWEKGNIKGRHGEERVPHACDVAVQSLKS